MFRPPAPAPRVLSLLLLLSAALLSGQRFAAPPADAPPPVPACAPTLPRPFVFLHIEKCGGSTVRAQLASYAAKNGVLAYIPCFFGVPCTSRLDQLTVEELVGGARIWANHHEFWRMERLLGPGAEFDCFALLRDPDERTVSHFLFFEDLSRFANMSDARFAAELDSGIFPPESGNLLTMKLHRTEVPWEVRNATLAKETLDRCAVGIRERWNETMLVLGQRFPWLRPHVSHAVENAQAYSGEKKRLARVLMDKIKERNMNAVDREVYEYAVGRFEQQLKELGR
ncbi:hypothetical protein DFJ74DRAFT_676538 [Hyaloraphidium curvatum]|nr:hypothetical protein DFJ74DRAFT_676538 [Hyaloraphidium curvatum]